jgi:hypothetical protein
VVFKRNSYVIAIILHYTKFLRRFYQISPDSTKQKFSSRYSLFPKGGKNYEKNGCCHFYFKFYKQTMQKIDSQMTPRSEIPNEVANTYATKKTLVSLLFNIALFAANLSQVLAITQKLSSIA